MGNWKNELQEGVKITEEHMWIPTGPALARAMMDDGLAGLRGRGGRRSKAGQSYIGADTWEKSLNLGTSIPVQQLRLHLPMQGSVGLIPGQELRAQASGQKQT